VRGVIFDFNGVLVFDSPLHHLAWRKFTLEIRGTALSDVELAECVMGRTNFEILRYLLGRPPVPSEVTELGGAKERCYRELCTGDNRLCLSPGAVELFTLLQQRGIPFTIATSSERENLDFFIECLELERWFDLSRIVFDDGTRPGKPAPDVYLEAARRLHLMPSECAVVEDAISGMQAASAAQIGRIFGLGSPEDHARFRSVPGVTDTLTTLREFPIELLDLEVHS
jgi:beta-phosphoglucomutase-like phosphatase (HAD superfamily)